MGAATAVAQTGATKAPQRVVSINMCTDQLALMLAAPGQLVSVSRLSQDPQGSPVAQAASALPGNTSRAEEIYLLNPDLVLASTFTAPATLAMLRGLGIEIALFTPATTLASIPENIAQMGAVLGRQDAASAVIAAYSARLKALSVPPETRPRVALTMVNSYASGRDTLAGDILTTAGFDNIADEAGLSAGGTLPLERLVLLAPEVIIQGHDFDGHARAEDNLHHPALRALRGTYHAGALTTSDWTCGTPAILNALENMVDLRKEVQRK